MGRGGEEVTQDNEDVEAYWDADGKAVPRRTRSEMQALLATFNSQIGPLDCWSLGALEELEYCWIYGIDQERFIRANGGRPSVQELGEPICNNYSTLPPSEDAEAREAKYQVPTVACKTCGLVISRFYAEDGECERCASWVK